MPARPARGGGFTLVEVLVALLIMAIIASMGWQGVSAMGRARERSAAASERTLRLVSVIGQWEQDLEAVYDSQRVPGLQFDGATLRLTRRLDGGVQVVAWSLRNGVWQRWASPIFNTQGALNQAWQASLQLQGNETGQLTLLEGVSGWQIYYFRGQTWTNAQSSADVEAVVALPPGGASGPGVATATRTLLPTGVRLQLALSEGTLHRDVMLAPQP